MSGTEPTIGEHAIVIGASVGGLLAARALTEAYDRVTIIERDQLPATAQSRKGVSQGRHAHVLLPSGQRVLEELFVGLADEVVADGGVRFRTSAFRPVFGGHAFCRADVGTALSVSRPFLEAHIRRRVVALDNVTIIERCEVVGPTTDGSRVTGVRARRRQAGSAEEAVDAELVVDASGRGGRALTWLDGLGYERPPEDELRVGVRYATRHLRLREGALGDDRAVGVGAVPGRPTGMYAAAQEHGWWICTLFGYEAHPPSTEPGQFNRFLGSLAPADVAAAVEAAEPLTDVVTHAFPSNLWRRYDKLRRFPAGLLVFGDAICSFNPIYGQGMSVAALEAIVLRRELARAQQRGQGGVDWRRFFRGVRRPISDAWDLATGADLALPEVPGRRPLKVKLLGYYVDRVQRAAHVDPAVAAAFLRVTALLDRPPALLRPSIMVRAIRHGGSRTAAPEPSTLTHPAPISDPRV